MGRNREPAPLRTRKCPERPGRPGLASAPSLTVARAVGRFCSAHSSVTQGKTEHTPVQRSSVKRFSSGFRADSAPTVERDPEFELDEGKESALSNRGARALLPLPPLRLPAQSVASARPIPQSLRARVSIRQYGEAVSSVSQVDFAPILPLPVERNPEFELDEGKESALSNRGARALLPLPPLRLPAQSVASARPIPQSLRARLSIRQYREAVSSGF